MACKVWAYLTIFKTTLSKRRTDSRLAFETHLLSPLPSTSPELRRRRFHLLSPLTSTSQELPSPDTEVGSFVLLFPLRRRRRSSPATKVGSFVLLFLCSSLHCLFLASEGPHFYSLIDILVVACHVFVSLVSDNVQVLALWRCWVK